MEPTPSPTPAPPRAPRLPPPLFSWGFLGVCVLVFLPHAASGPNDQLALYGPAVAAGEWWRVLTANVEHVSALHIFMNGLSIFSFGPVLERVIGSTRLFVASLIAALTSSAAALAFMWAYPSVGASGVIAGWLGLALPIFQGRARKVLWQWTLLLVLISLVPHVSWGAHLGGFVGGAVLGLIIRGTLRSHPTEPFRNFDRLALPLLLVSAALVFLVVRFHAATGRA
ncbi:MAG TPA: rhomboid family intramembrane serine protease [Myxococcaceae bacterium]|nr:rhomboid family intramembrane serine protease [Myxococcaceae bacterium]